MKFILDTNVVVSALVGQNPHSTPRVLLRELSVGSFISMSSEDLLCEIAEVRVRPNLARLHRKDVSDISAFVEELRGLSTVRDPTPSASPPPDRKDAHVWALLFADADAILITGDGLLQRASPTVGRVLSPAEALRRLHSQTLIE